MPDRRRGFKAERILRILLNHTDGEFTKYRIAKVAETSEEWVLEYTNRLERDGLIDDTTVLDPRALYERWREIRVEPTRLKVALQQPMELLAETELVYALSTYRAENLVQGYLFPSMTDLYIHPDQTEEWTEIIQEQGLVGGGNMRIRVTDEHVFYNTQRRNQHVIVSMPQLIVDLLDEGGPCSEAAEMLLATFHDTG